MSSSVKELASKAMKLSPDDRVVLAQIIWKSIEDFVDPDIEKAWLTEAERRWEEIKSGKVKCIPAEKVFKDIEKKLKAND